MEGRRQFSGRVADLLSQHGLASTFQPAAYFVFALIPLCEHNSTLSVSPAAGK
jgi:hypothetical protein